MTTKNKLQVAIGRLSDVASVKSADRDNILKQIYVCKECVLFKSTSTGVESSFLRFLDLLITRTHKLEHCVESTSFLANALEFLKVQTK